MGALSSSHGRTQILNNGIEIVTGVNGTHFTTLTQLKSALATDKFACVQNLQIILAIDFGDNSSKQSSHHQMDMNKNKYYEIMSTTLSSMLKQQLFKNADITTVGFCDSKCLTDKVFAFFENNQSRKFTEQTIKEILDKYSSFIINKTVEPGMEDNFLPLVYYSTKFCSQHAKQPCLVLTFTETLMNDAKLLDSRRAIVEGAKHPICFSFVHVGSDQNNFKSNLQKLDDIKGSKRKFDNVQSTYARNFIHKSDTTNNDIEGYLLSVFGEFPSQLQKIITLQLTRPVEPEVGKKFKKYIAYIEKNFDVLAPPTQSNPMDFLKIHQDPSTHGMSSCYPPTDYPGSLPPQKSAINLGMMSGYPPTDYPGSLPPSSISFQKLQSNHQNP